MFKKIILISLLASNCIADGLEWERRDLGFPDDRSLITGELIAKDVELDLSDFMQMQMQRELLLGYEEAQKPIDYQEYIMYKDLFPEIYSQKKLDRNDR